MPRPDQLIKSVREIYSQLDSQLAGSDFSCRACGQCCDFKNFDHLLFVTPPELKYLCAKIGPENIKAMTTGICPYRENNKCSIHEHRFAGCRIFFCKADADRQSQLTESTLEKLKSLCEKFNIPYRYLDLAKALNTFED